MAQKKFSVICNSVSQAAPATLFNLISTAATARPRIYEIDVGSTVVAPVDQASLLVLGRTTVVGTAGSNPTPQPLDAQEIAALTVAAIAHSGEPTYAATYLYQFPLNHRASWRWVAAPDSEFIATIGSANGLALKQSASSATYGLTGTVLFFE